MLKIVIIYISDEVIKKIEGKEILPVATNSSRKTKAVGKKRMERSILYNLYVSIIGT
ncbi:hypothetical protein C1H46_042131 [Malus baccata]|uniref:Uncharacterized protein n=1 Tax=Malus baccata TaxID=106549 RepID=A0A540KDM3_MALBA|nr:hypothetical protein C1H46_042131 [Malus baccata]